MSNTITAIKHAAKVAVKETLRPRQFEAGGKRVVCSQYGTDGFQWHGDGTLGTRYKILAIEGYALRCSRCSHLELFGKRPEEL